MGRRSAGEGGLKVRVVSVGKDRSGLFQPAVDEYAGRLRHYVKIDIVELPAKQSADEEADAILAKLSPSESLVALDERGEPWSSVELSRFIGKAQQEARELVFAIGGDEGHGQRVRDEAKKVWSLSKLTLPHRLARVVLVEQLYRAFTLLRGEPYHK